jgi:hypothetical protein
MEVGYERRSERCSDPGPELGAEILYLFVDASSLQLQIDTLLYDEALADKRDELKNMQLLADQLFEATDDLRRSVSNLNGKAT